MAGRRQLDITRHALRIEVDPKRVIARLYIPDGEVRTRAIIDRVLGLPDPQVSALLAEVMAGFGDRHRDVREVLRRHFEQVSGQIPARTPLSADQALLIGSYFTCEYSLESVALFNPSMVLHPDQSGLAAGACRFIMSLRACGEGHISSIEFRSGVIDASGGVTVDPISPYAAAGHPVADKQYKKHPFFLKLIEMGAYNEIAQGILDALGDRFTFSELEGAVAARRHAEPACDRTDVTADNMLWLAHSNYHLDFPADSEISERVVFPVSENESRGIEDARFVRFTYANGRVKYYATYTAYNGFTVLPQFIETEDFRKFHIITLNGRYAQNKGMALFPRKIDGAYMMISRVDGESLYLMGSGNLHFWNEGKKLCEPLEPWEFMQIGNCGSPLETEVGWLLLTHGVGPMRRYCLGAMLLDLADPSRVIGQLEHPLLIPTEQERDGYVPNVVYSCGAMIHKDALIIPYAMSDTATGFATVSVSALLDHLMR